VQAQDKERSAKLMDWCISYGLLCMLAQGSLLVMGLDPAPWLARGSQGRAELAEGVVMATGAARRLQVLSLLRWVSSAAALSGRIISLLLPSPKHALLATTCLRTVIPRVPHSTFTATASRSLPSRLTVVMH
jgi:hypothetical protein